MSVTYPVRIGGFISAFDSDSISTEISIDGLPIGTKVWNEDVGAFFTLTLSTASLVADEILEVLGITGARWIVDQVITPPIPNADLAEMASLTIKSNLSGSSAVPSDNTIASVAAAMNLPGPWTTITVEEDAQDVTISSLNGATDGGYEIWGYLAATAGNEAYHLQPNGADTNCFSTTTITLPASITRAGGAYLFLVDAATGDTPMFKCTIDGAAGNRMFLASGWEEASDAAEATIGRFLAAGANITSLVIHGNSADSFKAGSVIKWRKLNAT